MPIPSYDELMLPVLQELRDGQEHHVRDVRERIAGILSLTEADRNELLPSGKQFVFDNRVGWAKTYMEKAGLVRTVRRGVYQITDRGLSLLQENPKALNNEVLERFSEFRDFRDGGLDSDAIASGDDRALQRTPVEQLEAAYRELRRNTELQMLEAVSRASPGFFERLVVELLVKMGYGGSLEEAGKVLGRSHDGGLDGVINEDPLGLDVIYLQAKRWQKTVGRPDIQAFTGTLEGERARKGVFITTSGFSNEAREYVKRIDKKIVLIDGTQLAALMFENDLGVATRSTFAVKVLDSDFFAEE